MKRLIDIIGATIGIVFMLPFVPFIMIAIVMESGFPIIIKLNRVSAGKIIGVYKFRSMTKDAAIKKEEVMPLNERDDGPFFKAKDDPRITKIGKFLRKTRIDEFPQFINVLKGELSLVGPRPHEPEEMLNYPPEFWKIFLIKGGVTGLAQIEGPPYLPFRKELNLDLWYVENHSLWIDLKILLKTALIFFTNPSGI